MNEDGIYLPRQHFDALLAEIDTIVVLVDRVTRVTADITRCRTSLIAAARRIRENDPDITPVQRT